MSSQLPPEYGRVTNPERYRVLHAIARELADELERTYDVSRSDTGTEILFTADSDTAADLTLTLTDFPGVTLQAGHALREAFPSCGCDACDDDPDYECTRLRETVASVVREHFRETLRDDWISSELGAYGRKGQRVSREQAAALGGDFDVLWAPWPRR
jgi:hypothetical protein